LPADKKKNTLVARIKERQATFFYSLDNEADGGLDPDKLKEALESIVEDKVWKMKDKKPITVEILHKIFNFVPNEEAQVEDLTEYFVKKGGYELPESVKAEEATYIGENK
jgi:hypothetical protein